MIMIGKIDEKTKLRAKFNGILLLFVFVGINFIIVELPDGKAVRDYQGCSITVTGDVDVPTTDPKDYGFKDGDFRYYSQAFKGVITKMKKSSLKLGLDAFSSNEWFHGLFTFEGAFKANNNTLPFNPATIILQVILGDHLFYNEIIDNNVIKNEQWLTVSMRKLNSSNEVFLYLGGKYACSTVIDSLSDNSITISIESNRNQWLQLDGARLRGAHERPVEKYGTPILKNYLSNGSVLTIDNLSVCNIEQLRTSDISKISTIKTMTIYLEEWVSGNDWKKLAQTENKSDYNVFNNKSISKLFPDVRINDGNNYSIRYLTTDDEDLPTSSERSFIFHFDSKPSEIGLLNNSVLEIGLYTEINFSVKSKNVKNREINEIILDWYYPGDDERNVVQYWA